MVELANDHRQAVDKLTSGHWQRAAWILRQHRPDLAEQIHQACKGRAS